MLVYVIKENVYKKPFLYASSGGDDGRFPAPLCRESSMQGKRLFIVVRSLTHAASYGECAR